MPAFVEENGGEVFNETTALLSEKQRKKYVRSRKEASKLRKGVVLMSCLTLQMISNGVGFGLGVMYVELIPAFNTQRSTAAFVQSLFIAITFGGGILWVPVLRKYGSGKCALVGSMASGTGLFISAFSSSIYMVIALTGIVAGLGMCVSYLAPYIVASQLFREEAAVPLVFLTTGASIGQFIFPYLYEVFLSQYGWRGTFMLISGLALQCIPASAIIYSSQDFMVSTDDDKQKGTNACFALCDCNWKLLATPSVLLLLSSCFFLSGTGNLEGRFLVDIMMLEGYKRETGSLFISLLGLFNFGGRFTGVILRHKIRIQSAYHWVYCMPILGIGHYIVITYMSYWPLLITCLTYGYVFGVAAALTPAIMLELVGLELYVDGMAFVNVFYGFGNLFGGTMAGVVKDSYGEYDPMFYLAIAACGFMLLAALLIAYHIRRKNNNNDNIATLEQSIVIYKRLNYGEK